VRSSKDKKPIGKEKTYNSQVRGGLTDYRKGGREMKGLHTKFDELAAG